MKKFLVCVILLLLIMSVPCSAAGKFPAVCDNGTFNGVLSSDNVITWLGVPYAKPPVGSLRWKAPQAPESSTGIFEADKFSAMPIQKLRDGEPISLMPQDEDCLYLNVWKASGDVAASRPVMVWVHGGSFRYNGTGVSEWLGHKLAADNPDIMVVSVGYRLGIMGFIDFSEVSGGESFAESGNLGILDVLQSLKWLKANIAAFGGDPDNITVFGQSSGSALISLLMTIPEAQGYFQRAILQSGSVSMSMARKSSAEDATELAKKLLDLTGKTDMAGLMTLTSQDLQNAAEKLDGALNFPERDGVVLTSGDIYEAFAKNAGNYDLLIGSNADEVRFFLAAIGSLNVYTDYLRSAYEQLTGAMSQIPNYGSSMVDAAEDFLALMRDFEPVWAYTEFLNDLLFRVPAIQMASSHTGTGKTYMYYWNIPTAAPYLACHGVELPFVFDIPGVLIPASFLNTAQGQAIRALVQQNIWVDFAKDGVINGMREYNTADRATIVISPDVMPISIENDPLSEQRQLITPLLAMNFSGRDVINLVSGGSSDDGDSQTEDEGDDNYKIGGSSSGCDSGMFSLMFLLPIVPVIIRKRR
ncbi:MAG: carboxylesterase family protein [Synergistaceae bacterium]|nr:carboxylesterase family protein [Synergistaceae bacterium]